MAGVLIAFAAGMAAGRAGLVRHRVEAWGPTASRWALGLMLACIGLRLGLDPALGGQLGRLGVHAAVFAVATAGGAVGAGILAAGGMALVRRRLARARIAPRRVPGRGTAPTASRTDSGADGTAAGAGAPRPVAPGPAVAALRMSGAAVLAVAAGWVAGGLVLHLAGSPDAVAGTLAGTPVASGFDAGAVAAGSSAVADPTRDGAGPGIALVHWVRRMAGAAAGYALLLLMALFGWEFGRQWPATRASLRAARAKAVVLPVVGGLGSLGGGWLAGRLLGEPPGLALAVAAAFGWYSMAGVVVAQLWGPAAGALAFLANVFRELLTVVAVPLLARRAGGRAWLTVLPGGATTMDTTLPVIAAAVRDAGITALAFVHGLVLTLAAPALIGWLARP